MFPYLIDIVSCNDVIKTGIQVVEEVYDLKPLRISGMISGYFGSAVYTCIGLLSDAIVVKPTISEK